jgi:uncharacterized protein GlcG (DUF336 family)
MALTLEIARKAVSAGLRYAEAEGVKMTVVVIDAGGVVVAAERMDGARTITYEIAIAKANTSREFEGSTADLKERVLPENKIAIGQLSSRPIAFLGGGMPLVIDGRIVGAVGASGGVEAQDVACALEAAEATGLAP